MFSTECAFKTAIEEFKKLWLNKMLGAKAKHQWYMQPLFILFNPYMSESDSPHLFSFKPWIHGANKAYHIYHDNKGALGGIGGMNAWQPNQRKEQVSNEDIPHIHVHDFLPISLDNRLHIIYGYWY